MPASAALTRNGASKIRVTPASAPPMVHTMVDTRRTLMPNSRPVSAFSADARMASPNRVRPKNSAKITITSGTTITTNSSAPSDAEVIGDLPAELLSGELRGQGERPRPGHVRQLNGRENGQLGHPQGGDEQHQARRVEQPPHHQQLGDHCENGRGPDRQEKASQ